MFYDDKPGVVLTVRELEIVQLVAQGYSAKEIALRVDIAPRTVERHIENARLKMRARNRAHLVTCAMTLGIFDAESQLFPAIDRRMPTYSRSESASVPVAAF